jgi:endonuclease-8
VPEGDTVWLACQRLNDALAGRVLTHSDFRVPQLATTDLTGQTVSSVVSRGKHQLIRLDSGQTLHTHFKMDGSWHLYRPGSKWSGGPDFHVRVVLGNEKWNAVGYRLPVVELLASVDEADAVGHLGPDLLGPDWNPVEALRRLLADPSREIGEALLDQRNLAGIGNLYKAETLFLSGVTPWTKVGAVGDLGAIVTRAQRLLEANKMHPAQSTTGDLRRGEQHWVFERAGRPCRRCGERIRVAMQGEAPRERVTYWCPRCQTGPSPVDARPPGSPKGQRS